MEENELTTYVSEDLILEKKKKSLNRRFWALFAIAVILFLILVVEIIFLFI